MPTSFNVTIVGNAPVTGISEAFDVNDAGVVVGQEDTVFPFVWRPTVPNGAQGASTRLACLPNPVAPTGVATAINNLGDVVGHCETVDVTGAIVTRAVLWRAGAGPAIDLGTLAPNPFILGTFLGSSKAFDISDAGVIVGESDDPTGISHAFVIDPAVFPLMRNLFSLVPSLMLPGVVDPSVANGVSNNGDVVGAASAIDAQQNLVTRAFLVPAGAVFMSDLGTLFPDPANPGQFLGSSSAIAINGLGTIIGDADTSALAGSSTGAFFSAGSAPAQMLAAQMTVLGCNDQDEVVGAMGAGATTAFRFALGGPAIGLASVFPGHTVERAVAINNHGQIAAVATDGSTTKAVLLTP